MTSKGFKRRGSSNSKVVICSKHLVQQIEMLCFLPSAKALFDKELMAECLMLHIKLGTQCIFRMR